MAITIFTNLKEHDKTSAVDRVVAGSTPSQDFFLMITLAVLTATFGVLQQNTPVIIGSMLIAPMLYPILSVALGITMNDYNLISRSIYTLLKSIALGIASATIATLLFSSQHPVELLNFTQISQSSLSTLAVAVIAGLAATFALVKPNLNEILPGTAISVTLIPPLAAIGIGVASLDSELIANSLLLFIVNAAGIIFVSTVTFSLMNFYKERPEVTRSIKKEDRKLESDIKKAKEASL